MIIIQNNGRLGNAMFRNCAASILAKKFNIKVEAYLYENELDVLRPRFYREGTRVYDNQVEVKYQNFDEILQQKEIDCGLNLICPCQSRFFAKNYKNEILNQFDAHYSQQHINNLFVHVRLGDCIKLNRVPSVEYYVNAIERTNFEKGYISSDTLDHEIVTYLIDRFNLIPYKNKPAETINFAKDFGSLVLSSGTFSWWMGVLSRSKNIFYPSGGPKWCGDIFVFDEWTPLDYK